MSDKTNGKDMEEIDAFKKKITENALGGLYIFYGEETYVKEECRNAAIKKVSENGFGEFNAILLEAESMDFSSLSDAVQSLPVMAESKLIVIRDFNFSKVSDDLKPLILDILENPQEGLCIIFYFESLEYKTDKRIKLWQAALKNCTVINFAAKNQSEINAWITQQFAENNKTIQKSECDYLTFMCGSLMSNLLGEIHKIASGATGNKITKEDIDRLASKVLDAKIFELTNAVSANDYAQAIGILRELLEMKFETVVLMGAIAKQIQKLYCAKLTLKNGFDENYLMKQFGMRSQYPATLLLRAAQKRSLEWLREAVILCSDTDMALKSNIPDGGRTIELFLLRLANLKL